MVPGLVSILTPCFNSERYISRLLESVLQQDYQSVEMIVIDDGSTDNTVPLVETYHSKFKAKGYILSIVEQPNTGQSVAISNGLDHIHGEYLVWPDSDDYYADFQAISCMVNTFISNDDSVGIVRSQERVVADSSNNEFLELLGENIKPLEDSSIFEDCLFQKNGYYYTPGGYMIKVSALIDSSELPIYTSRDAGQNWQLMLPILYNYKCASIAKPLFNVLYRVSSHSRSQMNYERKVNRILTYRDTILGTLNRIKNMPDHICNTYKQRIYKKYAKELLLLAIEYKNKADIRQHYDSLKCNDQLTMDIRIEYLLKKYDLITIYRICGWLKRKLVLCYR